jgi:radical SAM-linked protein
VKSSTFGWFNRTQAASRVAKAAKRRQIRSLYPEKEIVNELRYKVAIRFAIAGDLRFISHHDTMRLFERALSRAQLPVQFSKGFNPRPRLSLPLPRAVGIASQVELLVVELSEPVPASMVLTRLGEQMPAGLRLTQAWTIADRHSPQARQVEYAVPLPADCIEATREAAQRLLAQPTWTIERSGPGDKRSKAIDLRQYLADASVCEGALRWTAQVTAGGSLRPAELLIAVGLAPEEWQHRICRTAIEWASETTGGAVAETSPPSPDHQ